MSFHLTHLIHIVGMLSVLALSVKQVGYSVIQIIKNNLEVEDGKID